VESEASTLSRRKVVHICALAGVGVLGAGTLAACGGSSSAGGGSSSAAAAGGVITKLADLTVGQAASAKSPDGKEIILVRTADTAVTGLSAVCPHAGGIVAPKDGILVCPLHGSKFDLTGKVQAGSQAQTDLPAFAVTVDGENVVAG
jgi:nitrite reductase/ring-hydroxylating ferredoxin subunit